MAKIKLENVSFFYGKGTAYCKEALKKVNIEVKEGSITGLIGHTGSGKSTMLQLLNGLSTPSEGRINYELRKEVSKKIRKIERDIESLEKEIEKAETRISEIEAQFAEGVTEASLLKEYEQTKHTLDAKMYEWELLSEEVEGLRADL